MARTRIHVFHTGEVCVAPDLPFGGDNSNAIKASGVFGKKEDRLWLPVSAYLTECPQGKFLVDTGWARDMSPEGEFDRKAQIKSLGTVMLYEVNQGRIGLGQCIDEQLLAMGIKDSDIDAVLLTAVMALSLLAVTASAEEEANWAYGVTIEGVGTIYYVKAYFAQETIVNPLTAAAYTADEIAAIVNGAVQGAEGYTFDVPAAALLGMNGFWYDAANTAAITSHADPLTMNDAGVFSTADGVQVAAPMAE